MATLTKPNGFKKKSAKDAWFSDKGAYPLLGIMACAVTLCLSFMGYYLAFNVDTQVSKTTRKSILRGEEYKGVK